MDINDYVAEEIAKYQGIAFPVKSSLLRRFFVTKLKWQKMHPNPDDEFSMPEVGPSARIISNYENKYRTMDKGKHLDDDEVPEPIIVEKMHPDGYMIINGHHRWGACVLINRKHCEVKIVNLTQEYDVLKMIENCKHTKRVSFDLDEVVFCKDEENSEKKLGFPYSLFFKQRIRKGIPALFYFLKKNGYDIWVYSSEYYSFDTIKRLMKCYHADVDGVVTGMKVLAKRDENSKLKKAVAEKYRYTLNITDNSIIKISGGSNDFIDREIESTNASWSDEVMKIVKELDEEG